MGLVAQRTQAWKSLMEQLDKIVDPVLKNAMRAEFINRAIKEWGYNPQTGNVTDNNPMNLDNWEMDFSKDIINGIKYAIDVRKEKRLKEELELKKNMFEFIKNGGDLMDLPEDMRNSNYIIKTYFEMLKKSCFL